MKDIFLRIAFNNRFYPRPTGSVWVQHHAKRNDGSVFDESSMEVLWNVIFFSKKIKKAPDICHIYHRPCNKLVCTDLSFLIQRNSRDRCQVVCQNVS